MYKPNPVPDISPAINMQRLPFLSGTELLLPDGELINQSISDALPNFIKTSSEWLDIRPLLGHSFVEIKENSRIVDISTKVTRRQELADMTHDEALELTRAATNNQSADAIKEELGDVIFALTVIPEINLLANSPTTESIPSRILGNAHTPAELVLALSTDEMRRAFRRLQGDYNLRFFEHDPDWTHYLHTLMITTNLAFSYAALRKWNVKSIYQKTLEKNGKNYPPAFYSRWSPWLNYKDPNKALRILRDSYPNGLNRFWEDLEDRISENELWWIEPDGHFFRQFVREKLSEVRDNNTGKRNQSEVINALLDRGDWGYQPLWGSSSFLSKVRLNRNQPILIDRHRNLVKYSLE